MKKKGLIVATIVMVLVLAVSLTTATYAWFSSNASATVDDLEITTKAADGLQIAMINTPKSIADLQSGELTYADDTWTGAQPTWGTFLGFAGVQQGQWTNAVTNLAGTKTPGKSVYTVTTAPENFGAIGEKVYVDTASGKEIEVTNENFASLPAGQWCTKAAATDGQFLVPNGYDDNIVPVGYNVAGKNVNYYEFDIAVTNITGIYDLGMGILITPNGTNAGGTPADGAYPGMAAASRVELEFYKKSDGSETGTIKDSSSVVVTQLQPWGAWNLQANSTMTKGAVTTVLSADGSYQIQLEEGNTSISAGEVWYVTIRIWIEGTDNECDNRTAGTGFDVNIEFVYTKNDTDDFTYANDYGTSPTSLTVTFA